MAGTVIDLLEVVQVDESQGHRHFLAHAKRQQDIAALDIRRGELERWKETCITTFLVSGPKQVLAPYAEMILG